jgi:hypothetical protein
MQITGILKGILKLTVGIILRNWIRLLQR